MRENTGSGVVQVRPSFAGVFRRRAFRLGTSWAPTACILQALACGPGSTIGTPPLEVPDAAADAAADVADAAAADGDAGSCVIGDWLIVCGAGNFVCYAPANEQPYDCATIQCEAAWKCAPRDPGTGLPILDAGIGVCE